MNSAESGNFRTTITYSRYGDFFLPDIILRDSLLENPEPLTKYGIMRRTYLKDHHPIFYNSLLLKEELYPYLRIIQRTAEIRFEMLMERLIERNPPPDKAADSLSWTAHMNTLKHIAEEIVLSELIYS